MQGFKLRVATMTIQGTNHDRTLITQKFRDDQLAVAIGVNMKLNQTKGLPSQNSSSPFVTSRRGRDMQKLPTSAMDLVGKRRIRHLGNVGLLKQKHMNMTPRGLVQNGVTMQSP